MIWFAGGGSDECREYDWPHLTDIGQNRSQAQPRTLENGRN